MPFKKKQTNNKSDEKLLGSHIDYVQSTLKNIYYIKSHKISVKEMQSVNYKQFCTAFPELGITFDNFKLETNQIFKDFIRSRIVQKTPVMPILSEKADTIEDKVFRILPDCD